MMNIVQRSLSRLSLNDHFDFKENDSEEFAWIKNVPSDIKFAFNISQMYASRRMHHSQSIVKMKLWLETAGLCLSKPITKIMQMKVHEDLTHEDGFAHEGLVLWQLDVFDELISMNVPIYKLLDKQIEIVCEVHTLSGEVLRGSLKVFTEDGVMKSGLKPLVIGSKTENCDLFEMEERLYSRKSKQVPAWHVQLMKDRLREMKEEFCAEHEQVFVVNLIIPTPSHPLKLERVKDDVIYADSEDVCIADVIEGQEDSKLRRKYPKLFSNLTTSTLSNGDLRALNGILHRGFDLGGEAIPVDAANLLWSHREYLSRRVPRAIVHFVQSVQWWLAASDPLEIDEALRVIDEWHFADDSDEKMEIGVMLLVGMCGVNGLSDSPVWLRLFSKLIIASNENNENNENVLVFTRKYQSALILFLRRRETEGMKELRQFLKRSILFSETKVSHASELYWRLKTLEDADLFEEYKAQASEGLLSEFRKQERLFEAVENVLIAAQKVKGSRGMKLDALKRGLADPEGGVPGACQQQPILPGLQGESDRVMAVVSDRSNLFKSTAFTVLLVFLRQENSASLPIIFKRGDDLRKDAACLRLFRAIWDLWQREGGLELFERRLLYGVTAFKNDFGLVEYVESVPMSRIIRSEEDRGGEWAVCKYLQQLPDPQKASANFLSSCVGFSLLTYLLGIGDRHLDNLLVTPQGQLFHIDFSFLFGEDPKPFAPPIKITREMVRGFESLDSVNMNMNMNVNVNVHDNTDNSVAEWNEFKGQCFTALSLLRRKSPLILALLQSEYQSTSYPNEQYLKFVKERLKVLVSQAEGLRELDKLMEESRVAMFPVVLEAIHKWAQYWKS